MQAISMLMKTQLRYLPKQTLGFIVPGGNIIFCLLMLLGAFTSLFGFFIGFIPPDNLTHTEIKLFHLVMIIGLGLTLFLPMFFLMLNKKASATITSELI